MLGVQVPPGTLVGEGAGYRRDYLPTVSNTGHTGIIMEVVRLVEETVLKTAGD